MLQYTMDKFFSKGKLRIHILGEMQAVIITYVVYLKCSDLQEVIEVSRQFLFLPKLVDFPVGISCWAVNHQHSQLLWDPSDPFVYETDKAHMV